MTEKEECAPLKEAVHEVEVAITRLALMHLSFSKHASRKRKPQKRRINQ